MNTEKPSPQAAAASPRSGRFVKPEGEWAAVLARARALAPEAYDSQGRVLNLIGGEWSDPGHPKPFISPVDGTLLASFPMLDLEAARRAVRAAGAEARRWAAVDLDERRRRVSAAFAEMSEHRELLAYLLVWEIGKPYRQSAVEVERTIDGVEWYVREIESMMSGRRPLGLVSNIASWNYPLSVLVHAVGVQVLCGNPVIAKTPSDGGLVVLTTCFAIMRRHGLPVSLVSGSGGRLAEALVRDDAVHCLAFVGGKNSGRQVATHLYDRGRRYALEMEGVNAYGVWNFTDWDLLAGQMRKGFEYGKQRCTAYVRWVVERELFPRFLDTYLGVAKDLRYGHPLLVEHPDDPPPDVDFGPLINAAKVEELREHYSEALGKGAVMLHRGSFDDSMFLPDQDMSAYFRPTALFDVPRNAVLYHNEPFGPVDVFLVVDRVEELIAEMNVSNGALVGSIACDDPATARRISGELRAYKVGVNRVRSRGDREESFGGLGESWKGAFVGGRYLVEAVTEGPPGERLHGIFPDHTLVPPERNAA
jgi:acyl-CoA reductase-like NAD-dependent aldehyde dehydrogenase